MLACSPTPHPPHPAQVAAADVNAAYERVLKSDVKYRFVIAIEETLAAAGCGCKAGAKVRAADAFPRAVGGAEASAGPTASPGRTECSKKTKSIT